MAALVCLVVLAAAGTALAETEVTAKVQVVKKALTYNRMKKQSSMTVSVKNTSQDVLQTPVKLVVESLTPARVTVANADGATGEGRPYLLLTTASGQLLPGNATAGRRFTFANPKAARFSYKTKVMATILSPSDTDGDGFSEVEGDCNDNDPEMHPNTVWHRDADGDGYSDGTTVTQCQRGLDYYRPPELNSLQIDCEDGNSSVHPDAAEVCGDGIDQDCSGEDRSCSEFLYRLPDTGQTQSYTGSFGEDSDYLINPPSYTSDNGTVTDNNTGLMWQPATVPGTYDWYQATETVCQAQTTGGYTDWRLPTKKELVGIVDYSRFWPDASINTIFTGVASNYWSSTAYVNNSSYAWFVNFSNGHVDSYYKSNNDYVRCVRGGK